MNKRKIAKALRDSVTMFRTNGYGMVHFCAQEVDVAAAYAAIRAELPDGLTFNDGNISYASMGKEETFLKAMTRAAFKLEHGGKSPGEAKALQKANRAAKATAAPVEAPEVSKPKPLGIDAFLPEKAYIGKENAAEAILAARDMLTEDNWLKGSYFNVRNGILCACAHGAVQAEVNDNVVSAVKAFAPKVATAAAREGVSSAPVHRPGFSIESWYGSEADVRNRYAHWAMGAVGLTFSFNDAESTTLAMVKEKMTKAAEWAAKTWPKAKPEPAFAELYPRSAITEAHNTAWLQLIQALETAADNAFQYSQWYCTAGLQPDVGSTDGNHLQPEIAAKLQGGEFCGGAGCIAGYCGLTPKAKEAGVKLVFKTCVPTYPINNPAKPYTYFNRFVVGELDNDDTGYGYFNLGAEVLGMTDDESSCLFYGEDLKAAADATELGMVYNMRKFSRADAVVRTKAMHAYLLNGR